MDQSDVFTDQVIPVLCYVNRPRCPYYRIWNFSSIFKTSCQWFLTLVGSWKSSLQFFLRCFSSFSLTSESFPSCSKRSEVGWQCTIFTRLSLLAVAAPEEYAKCSSLMWRDSVTLTTSPTFWCLGRCRSAHAKYAIVIWKGRLCEISWYL